MSNISDALIIFLVMGSFIFFKGFQSNLDFLSISIIYGMFIGYLLGVVLLATCLVKFMDWLFKYSKRKLYQDAFEPKKI
jgi:hypothetical protein